jgi:hypothetical protein
MLYMKMMRTASPLFRGLCLLALGVVIGRWTAAVTTVSAQVPAKRPAAILIGNVPIRVGDPKDSVLTVLARQYKVVDRGMLTDDATEFLGITTPDSTSILGSVQFRHNRVVDATREWGDIGATDALISFFQKAYGALESASSETKVGVLLCKTLRRPDGVYTTVLLDFSGRQASIDLMQKEVDGKPFNEITVEESVSQPPSQGR